MKKKLMLICLSLLGMGSMASAQVQKARSAAER
jgi:Tfp pilus assembly protein PilX